jgi:hypothetical protein
MYLWLLPCWWWRDGHLDAVCWGARKKEEEESSQEASLLAHGTLAQDDCPPREWGHSVEGDCDGIVRDISK